MITTAAGISGKYVPFAGAGPSRTALLGGHIDFRVCQHTEAIGMIRAGKTKGIAISSDKRLEILPDVPTFKELGDECHDIVDRFSCHDIVDKRLINVICN